MKKGSNMIKKLKKNHREKEPKGKGGSARNRRNIQTYVSEHPERDEKGQCLHKTATGVMKNKQNVKELSEIKHRKAETLKTYQQY